MTEVVFATPCKTGQVWFRTAQAISNLMVACSARGIKTTWNAVMNDPYVHCARDALANNFLDHTKATHLMFIDDDVTFRPQDFFALIESDKGVIAGTYPQKKIDWDLVAEMAKKYKGNMLHHVSCPTLLFLKGGQGTFKSKDITKPTEVAYAPTGFMLIKREVLETYRKTYPEMYKNPRYTTKEEFTPFFYLGIHGPTKETIGEDTMFCFNVMDMGEKIYTLPYLMLGHMGFHEHLGCPFCAAGDPIHSVLDTRAEVKNA